MAAPTRPLSASGRLLIGLLCIAGGAVPVLAAFDLGPLGTRDIHGPPWLAAVAGGIFVLAGIGLMTSDGKRHTPLSSLLFALTLAGFAAISNWIAFGLGLRECSGSLDGVFFGAAVSELACRGAFAVGALILDGALVWVLARGLRQLTGPGPLVDRLDKIGQAAFLLGLLPVLLPLFLWLLGQALLGAVATRWRTGKWPRNEGFIARQRARRPK